MSVTGHKSVHSLSIYQKVKEDEKLMMGMSLTFSLLNPTKVSCLSAPQNLLKELPLPQQMQVTSNQQLTNMAAV